MEGKDKDAKMKINLSNMSVDSSLGLLAVGDVAFVEWRKVKKAHNIVKGIKVKEDNIDE